MKLFTLSKAATAFALATMAAIAPVAAHATTGNDQILRTNSQPGIPETIQYQQIDQSRIRITSSSHDFIIANGLMTATNKLTVQTEELPSTATDAAGNQVTLYYESTGKGEVIVTALLSNTQNAESTRITRAALNSDVRCWLGIGGSGIGGAIGGAAAGSVVPGLGTVAGGIAGAISGNAVGTATFC